MTPDPMDLVKGLLFIAAGMFMAGFLTGYMVFGR